MKEAIIARIHQALADIGIDAEASKIVLERPADMSHGDYATNVALIYAPKAGKKPLSLAIEILEKLNGHKAAADTDGSAIGAPAPSCDVKSLLSNVEKMEVAGPGFINFYVSNSADRAEIANILAAKENYGRNKIEEGKKIVFDYTDPNPFKVFHIGHLMTNVIGESFTRIAEASGAEVMRFCYQGDVGRHVALTMWGLRFMPKHETFPGDTASLSEKTAYFGKAYALGATEYKKLEDEAKASGALDSRGLPTSPEFAIADSEVQKLNKEIYERSNAQVNEIYDKGREWSLEHFEEIYKILGTKFDRYFFESQTSPLGLEIVHANTAPNGKAIFEESKSAVIFPGEKYDLHTRVFIKSDGLPTYEAKDLGLVVKKREVCDFDKSIIMTANEQNDYFKVIYKATELLFPELSGKLSHIGHGMMQFTTGKMSSRTGNVVTGESLLMSVIELANEKMKERDMAAAEKSVVAELVGVAALKYGMLHQAVGKNIIFDPEKALSFDGDSGPYLQYSAVRANALLAKAKDAGIVAKIGEISTGDAATILGDAGIRFEKLLSRFPETVERAWLDLAPHHIATYLTELASTFNSFYASTQIVKADDAAAPYKVALVEAFSIVMKNGLNLLGIKLPERM